MDLELLKYFLPEGLMDYFIITKVYEVEDLTLKTKVLQLDLEELNKIPSGYDINQYESKGFYPVKIIQDFPVRGKPVYLAIKRRRWRNKNNKNEVIHNDYSIIAEGAKITKELSDFLKDTDRDPNRYHW